MLSGLRDKIKQVVFNTAPSFQAPEVLSLPASEKTLLENERFKDIVFSLIRNIKDPEKPMTLEDLNIVYEEGIEVSRNVDNSIYKVLIEFTPTVPHCSLASLIGLCIIVKLHRSIPPQTRYKLKITLKEGTHNTAHEIIKQINDKERVAAAMEVGSLRELVTKCISENY